MTIEINQEVNNTRSTIYIPLSESQDGISELIEIPRPPSELIEGRKISPQVKKYLRDVFPLIIENLSVQGFNTPEKVNESLTNLASILIPPTSEDYKRKVTLIKNSLEFRLKNLRRQEELERLKDEGSCWIKTLGLIYEKVYSSDPKVNEAFFNNFACVWMLNTREKMRKISQSTANPEETFAKAEQSLNQRINDCLSQINPQEVRGKGGLKKLLYTALKDASLEDFIRDLAEEKTQEVPSAQADRVCPFENISEGKLKGIPTYQEISQAAERITNEGNQDSRYLGFRKKIKKIFENVKGKKIVQRVVTASSLIIAGLTLRSASLNPASPFQASASIQPPQGIVAEKSTPETPPSISYTPAPIITNTSSPFTKVVTTLTPKQSVTPHPLPATKETPQGEEPKKFEITAGEPITITIDTPNRVQLDLSFVPLDLKEQLRIKPTGQIIQEMKKPDPKTAFPIAQILNYRGNTWIMIDSGYQGTTPLGAEDERKKIEGGGISKSVPLLSDEEINKNLENLTGQEAIVRRSDGSNNRLRVVAAVRVPHEDVEEFMQTAESSLEVLIRLTGGNNSPLAKYKEDGNALFYTLCGWGPRDREGWWSWTRYVIVLEPSNNILEPRGIQVYP